MKRNREVPVFSYILLHGFHRSVNTIILREVGEIVGEIHNRELTLWHPHLLTDLIDRVREDDRLRVEYIF
jgi:hypothetical protein